MQEKGYKPNIVERLGVVALLWIESHIDSPPPDPRHEIRRWIIKGALAVGGAAGLGIGVTIAGSALSPNREPENIVSLPDRSDTVPIARHFEALGSNVQILKGVGFLQQVEGVDLDINEKAFLSWMDKTGVIPGIIFGIIFNSTEDFTSSMYQLRIGVPVERRWQDNVSGKNETELLISSSTDLSASVAVIIDLVRQNGFQEAIKMIENPQNFFTIAQSFGAYKEQFEKGKIPLFIVARQVPDEWIRQKLGRG